MRWLIQLVICSDESSRNSLHASRCYFGRESSIFSSDIEFMHSVSHRLWLIEVLIRFVHRRTRTDEFKLRRRQNMHLMVWSMNFTLTCSIFFWGWKLKTRVSLVDSSDDDPDDQNPSTFDFFQCNSARSYGWHRVILWYH